MNSFCRKCGVKLVSGENWYLSRKKRGNCICKSCESVYRIERNSLNREKIRELAKRSCRKNCSKRCAYHCAYAKANSKEVCAHARVYRAVKKGLLVKPLFCPNCTRSGCRIEAHHDNYDLPLDVRWLCSSCHRLLHDGWILREGLGLDLFKEEI